INSRAVQKWVSGLVNEDYDSDTIRLAFAVFRGAIRYALDHEMLLKNPLAVVEIRRNIVRLRGAWEVDTTKTDAGIRSFTLPASFIARMSTLTSSTRCRSRLLTTLSWPS